jgi:hypothetical protein
MNAKNFCLHFLHLPRVIRHFGGSWLVQIADGHFELVGGSEADYAEAQEWASLFAHEVVFDRPAGIAQSHRPRLDKPPEIPPLVPRLKQRRFKS